MHAIEAILAGYLSHIEKRPVKCEEIRQMGREGKNYQILERLASSILINKNLKEIKMVEPISLYGAYPGKGRKYSGSLERI